MTTTNRPLRVFLCHSSNDKPIVRKLYQKLRTEAWVDPWLDKMKILPGQNWRIVIEQAVEDSDVVIICLSNHSVNKEGFVQREISYAYDIALEKPEGVIFLIPLRLEECDVPRGMRSVQWADYFGNAKQGQYSNLLSALNLRHQQKLRLEAEEQNRSQKNEDKKSTTKQEGKPVVETKTRRVVQSSSLPSNKPALKKEEKVVVKEKLQKARSVSKEEPNITPGNRVVKIPVQKKRRQVEKRKSVGKTSKPRQGVRPLIGQIARSTHKNKIVLSNNMEFMNIPAGKFIMGDNHILYANPQHLVDIPYDYWMGRFPITKSQYNQFTELVFDKNKEEHPVELSWNSAQNYAKWLNEKCGWQLPRDYVFRLPSEAEWEKSARGEKGLIYPWGNNFSKTKCNTYENGKYTTTPVDFYLPQGNSPYGCADMLGNVQEWTLSIYKKYPYHSNDGRENEGSEFVDNLTHISRGGAYYSADVHCASRHWGGKPLTKWAVGGHHGFRLVIAPPLSK